MNDFNSTTQPIRRFFSLRRDVKSYVPDPVDLVFDLRERVIDSIPEHELAKFTPTAWSFLLMTDPTYAEFCPWHKLSSYQINKIYKVHPDIITSDRIAHLSNTTVQNINIEELPNFVFLNEETAPPQVEAEEPKNNPIGNQAEEPIDELTPDLSIQLDDLEDQPPRKANGFAWTHEEADIHYNIVVSGVVNFVKILKHEYHRQHFGKTTDGPMIIRFKAYNLFKAYNQALQKCKFDCRSKPACLHEIRHSLLFLQSIGYLTFTAGKTKPLCYTVTIHDPSLDPKILTQNQFRKVQTFLYNNRYSKIPLGYKELEEQFYHSKIYLDKMVFDKQLYLTKNGELCYQYFIVDGLAYSHIARLALLMNINIGYFRENRLENELPSSITPETILLRQKGYLKVRHKEVCITKKGKYILFSLFDQIPELNPFKE